MKFDIIRLHMVLVPKYKQYFFFVITVCSSKCSVDRGDDQNHIDVQIITTRENVFGKVH
jgi:hypothetical protein